MTKQVRVLRVLEYTGSQEWVNNTLATSSVKGEHWSGDNVIRESIIGYTMEVLSKEEQ